MVRLVAQPGGSVGIRSGGGFRDGDAGKEHVTSEHFKKFVAEMPEKLSATPKIISQTIDATGWSEMGEMKVA